MNILYWARRAVNVVRRKPIPLRTVEVSDEPDVVQLDQLYLIGNTGTPWAAMFLCPCGCEATIALNLLSDSRPYWNVRRHRDSTSTLYPSINRTVGCGSHFWIRTGVVEWAMSETRMTRESKIERRKNRE